MDDDEDCPDADTGSEGDISDFDCDEIDGEVATHVDHLYAEPSPEISYSDFANIDNGVPTPRIAPDQTRLFGEVGKSGFAESGIFGAEPPPAVRHPALDSSIFSARCASLLGPSKCSLNHGFEFEYT